MHCSEDFNLRPVRKEKYSQNPLDDLVKLACLHCRIKGCVNQPFPPKPIIVSKKVKNYLHNKQQFKFDVI